MAAVERLFNPFRDEKKAKGATGGANQRGKDPPGSAAFTFTIDPIVDFSTTTSVITPSSSFSPSDGDRDLQDDPDFDPFHVVSPESVERKQSTRKTATPSSSTSSGNDQASVKTPKPRALTPKLMVKLSTHEEVTSRVKMAIDEFDVTSEITVEGTVFAQVQCSDASKNAPFALLVPRLGGGDDQSFVMQPNHKYAISSRTTPTATSTSKVPVVVTIPKQDIVAVPVAYYSYQKEVKFMPVLVERKVTRNGSRVRIAVQIRSRLDNAGDMIDLTVLVAVPEKVNGNTVKIVRGATGVWDDLKRTIKWKVPNLVKGHSALVIAEADLWNCPTSQEDETPFPVMFRCSSSCDSMSSLDWKVAQMSDTPSQISKIPGNRTFRLLHRLP